MGEDICLLVTLYQHSEEFGDSLVRCALRLTPPVPGFSREYPRENVNIEEIFAVRVDGEGEV